MTAAVVEVVHAYAALWAERDPHKRETLLVRCLAEDAEIVGPRHRLRGRRAIAEDVVRFQREQPGSSAVCASGIDAHSGWARFAVRVVAPDGAVTAEGLDLAEFGADGRIVRVITFWGPLPAPAQPAVRPAAEFEHAGVAYELHDDTLPAEPVRIVDTGLGDANERAAPVRDVRRLACFARAPDGTVVGGAVGRTWGECCHLQQLWVDAACRHRGIGTQLMRRFEERAAARGCRTFYLDTFSFQAPELYRRLGYRSALELRGFAPDIVCHTMLRQTGPSG